MVSHYVSQKNFAEATKPPEEIVNICFVFMSVFFLYFLTVLKQVKVSKFQN